MNRLPKMRSSNLVLLVALPVLLYLFANSSDYRRSIVAIVGIEPEAGPMFMSFAILVGILVVGIAAPFLVFTKRLAAESRIVPLIVSLGILCLLVAPNVWRFDSFLNAVVVHHIDAVRSPEVLAGSSPWQLVPDALNRYMGIFHGSLVAWSCVMLVLALSLLAAGQLGATKSCRLLLAFVLGINLAGLAYILLVAHLGFASGLVISLRAVIFAYVGASTLGLIITGLLTLRPKRHTIAISAALVVMLAGAAVVSFIQPNTTYLLAGNLSGKIAVLPGTPQRLIDTVRDGAFVGSTSTQLQIRTVSSVESGMAAIAANEGVSAILAPDTGGFSGLPPIWYTSVLPDLFYNLTLTCTVLACLLIILILSAKQHGSHPLAVAAELFVDTVRGIPMLVIVLYVGLPLSGALRDVTGGGIDLPSLWRGVAAIAIGYSAYMAEIFRAGIQSIPKGQIEAAHSLGLSRIKTARLVVLPQALKVITPALGNEFIAMLKDTSLLSVLSVRDVTQRMREFQASSFLPFAPFNAAAILYVVLTLAIASILNSLERRMNKSQVR